MSSKNDLPSTRQNVEAVIRERKHRAAQDLFEQLTAFAESIATEASGDGDFDVEFSNSIYMSRACLLRWMAINSPHQAINGQRTRVIS